VRHVSFSCFALPDSFLTFRGRRVPFSCFARHDLFSTVPGASGPIFMFCVPELIFDETEVVGSPFHVLRSRARFRGYGGRRLPFSCFARPDSFSAVLRATGPVFMFCPPGLVSRCTGRGGSIFHILRSLTRFLRYRVRRVSFSCFALPDSFSTYRGCRVSFSCFARPDSFSMVTRAYSPDFMFCVPGLILSVTEGVGSRFNVLRARSHFRRCGGRRVLFSCFARPNSFSAVWRAWIFHVLRSRTRFRRYRGRRVQFS
jgi:hypothetical protein